MAYHVLIDGEQRGPYETATVAEMIGRGEVTAETLVWTADMTDWMPARDVAELTNHFGDAPAGVSSAGRPPAHSIPLPGDGAPMLRLDIGRAFSEGFGAVLHQPIRVLGMMVVYFAIAIAAIFPYIGVTMLGWSPAADGEAAGGFVVIILVTYIFSLAVNSALYGGLSNAMLRSVRNEPFGVGSLLAGFGRIVPLFIFFVLYIIAVSIGLLLLVVPGVFLIVAFALTPFLIMDRRSGAFAGMRGSLKSVMGVGWWRTFAVMIILFVGFAAVMLVVISGLGAGAAFMATSAAGDPTAGGASAAAIIGIVLIQMALGVIFAALYSGILASIYEQARPALDAASDG